MPVHFKTHDVTQSRYDHTISLHSSSRGLEQVGDQGMRCGKEAHTIKDSYYHGETGAEKTQRGGGGAANTSKVR